MTVMAAVRSGEVHVDGVRVHFDVHGPDDAPAVVMVPGWPVAGAEMWKAQVPFLARTHRVVAYDPPGYGRSDRPTDPRAYRATSLLGVLDAVLAASGSERAALVGISAGAGFAVGYAALHPDRVAGLVLIGAAVPIGHAPAGWVGMDPARFDEPSPATDGWGLVTREGMWRDYDAFCRFFAEQVCCEPHSSKQVEDVVRFAAQTEPAVLGAFLDGTRSTDPALEPRRRETFQALCDAVRCPVLVVHGSDDRIAPHASGVALADALNAELLTIEGGGHGTGGRDPVVVNRAIRDFLQRAAPARPARRSWIRPDRRRRRVLYLSSPIGLGHVRRDLAIAAELRAHHPDAEIEWLAQPPVAAVLEAAGENVHEASAVLASEASHLDGDAGEHDLHVFESFRRADALLLHNYLVFDDVVDQGHYDLVVGDEAWEVDFFLHENPERKRFAFAWLTDFVGYVPMPSGGEREARLAADYNAQMIAQVERYRRVRDRAIFVGDLDDVVPLPLGPSLPTARDWVDDHFDFSGYITGVDPLAEDERGALRERLGYRDGERVCIVAVGGSATGRSLLKRVGSSFGAAARKVDGLRMVLVAGPRIDPREIDAPPGVEVLGYVPDLWQHLAACDAGVVQGGLTTCMELVANRRPFVSFPLRNHFEQQVHVRHRLERYGATRVMDYDASTPDDIAAAIAEAIDDRPSYLPVAPDGARRAATALADLL